MPKKYASGIKVIKRRNKWKVLMVTLLILCVTIFAGDVIASLLRMGSIGIFGSSVNSKSYTLYACVMGEADSKADAETLASKVAVAGGGAYIHNDNGKYKVYACIYRDESSANKVASGITGYDVKVEKIQYNKIKITNNNITKSDIKIVQNSLDYLYTMYTNMYDGIMSLDTKNITNIALSNNMNHYKAQAKTYVANLMKLNANYNNSKISKIIDSYIVIIDSLDACTSALIQSNNVSHVSKYTLCEVCMETYLLHLSI